LQFKLRQYARLKGFLVAQFIDDWTELSADDGVIEAFFRDLGIYKPALANIPPRRLLSSQRSPMRARALCELFA
jgi:hypothetical protein